MADRPASAINDWQTVDPGDWQTVGSEKPSPVAGIPASYNGGQPPGVPAPPPPAGLQEQPDNFWTSPNGLIRSGARQALHGVEQMAEPGADAKMGGASQVLRGAAKFASPVAIGAAIPAAVAAPLATAGTMAGSAIGGSTAAVLGRSIVAALGGGAGAQDLATDAGAAAGGGVGGALGNVASRAAAPIANFVRSRDPEALAEAVGENLPLVGKMFKAVRSVPARNTPTFTGKQNYPLPTTGTASINPEIPDEPLSDTLTTPPPVRIPKPVKTKPAKAPTGPLYNPPPVNIPDQPSGPPVYPPPPVTFPQQRSGPPVMPPPPIGRTFNAPPQNPSAATPPSMETPAPEPPSSGPSAAPGSIVIPPTEGVPSRYGDIGGQFGSKMAADAYAKDVAIAQHLNGKGITPDQVRAAPDAQRKAWAKEANPKYKGINPDRLDDLIAAMNGGAQ